MLIPQAIRRPPPQLRSEVGSNVLAVGRVAGIGFAVGVGFSPRVE